jgi:hypothetical protein
VASGVLLGIALELLTVVVARYGPQGTSSDVAWSFRGNGALIVPFGLGPAILAGGWTAILLHHRDGARYLQWAAAVFVAGAAVVLIDAVATVNGIFGLANVLTLIAFAWPLIAPLAVVILQRKPQANPVRHAVAQAAFTVSGLAGFALAQVVLPPGA